MPKRIGNLRALAEAMISASEHEGNEGEHEMGILLINAARSWGMSEDQIVEAVSTPRK